LLNLLERQPTQNDITDPKFPAHVVGEFLKTFKEFPPRQRPASFSIDQALEKARQQQTAMATPSGQSNARGDEAAALRPAASISSPRAGIQFGR
jgi:hypothetical protein